MNLANHLPLAMAAGLVGLLAGALVCLVARSLPERGCLLSRPACPRCGVALSWLAAGAMARLVGLKRSCPVCWNGPAATDVGLELATALAFFALALRWPLGPVLAVHLLFAALLLAILAIDLRHCEVYLVLGLGGIVLALILAPFSMSAGFGGAALGIVVGTAIFGLLYLLGRLLYRGGEPLGTGDVTIAAVLGAMAGYPGVLVALTLGILSGGIGAVLVLARRGGRKSFMPYGPALCIGGILAMLVAG